MTKKSVRNGGEQDTEHQLICVPLERYSRLGLGGESGESEINSRGGGLKPSTKRKGLVHVDK